MSLRGATLRDIGAFAPESRSPFIARQRNRGPASRTLTPATHSGIASVDRPRPAPNVTRCPSRQAPLGSDHRGNPPRPAAASQLAAPTSRPIVSSPHHRLHTFPIPLLRMHARKRSRTRAANRSGRGHQAGGIRPQSKRRPAVKTGSPRLSPRGADAPSVPFRLWGENPGRRASSPTTVLPFGPSIFADPKKPLLGLLDRHWRTPGNRRPGRESGRPLVSQRCRCWLEWLRLSGPAWIEVRATLPSRARLPPRS